MAPKRNPTLNKPQSAHTPSPSTSSPAPSRPSSSTTPSLSPNSSPQDIAVHVWRQYLDTTPPRTLLLDTFMAFLVLVGGVQFVYCVIAGNYPFNAFLSGFSAAVGQFVLTASLRMQTTELPASNQPGSVRAGKKVVSKDGELVEEGKAGGISSERAFADYVFGSVILHFFCVNFIN